MNNEDFLKKHKERLASHVLNCTIKAQKLGFESHRI